MSGLVALVYLAIVVLLIASVWIVYTKASQPGWACLIPFYNIWVLLKIVGRPGWWLILYFIPFVNIVIWIIVAVDLSHSFGKGGGFAVGLILLPFVFYPILAWGDATYEGPAASGGTAPSPQSGAYGSAAVPPPPPAVTG